MHVGVVKIICDFSTGSIIPRQ